MNRYLIDVPTLTSVWVTARTAAEAVEALHVATADMELRFQIGSTENPIELINFTCRGEPDILSGDEDEEF